MTVEASGNSAADPASARRRAGPTVAVGRGSVIEPGRDDASIPATGAFAKSLNILPEMLLIGCGAALILGLLTFAAARQDEVWNAAEVQSAQSMLRRELAVLGHEVEDVIAHVDEVGRDIDADARGEVVSDAARRLIARGEADGVYVFTADGRLREALRSDGRADATATTETAAGLSALAKMAHRAAESGGVAHADGGRGASPPRPVATVLAPIGATPAGGMVLGAAGVIPAAGVSRPTGGEAVVLVRALDAGAMARMGDENGFARLRVEAPPPADGWGIALRAADGSTLGGLAWNAEGPGRAMLERVLVPVVVVLLVMGGLAYMALARSTAAARAMREAARTIATTNHELETSRRRFRDFAEAASDWFWETDAALDYSYVSERLSVILGRSPDEVMGASLLELGVMATDLGMWREAEADIRAHRAFRDMEIAYRDASGRSFVFRVSGQPVFGEEARGFAGYRGTGVDVSIETLALVEARFMQVLVHDALDSISEGFVLFNADGRLVVCNERYRQAYPNIADVLVPGVTFEEVLRVAAERGGVLERQGDIGSWVQQRLARHLENPAPVDRRLSDGRWYRISEHATGSGGVVKLLMDITELKDREEELAGNSARLKATLDSISQGVGMFDRHDDLAAWNEDFPRLLGLPRGFADFGRPLADFARWVATLSPVLARAFVTDEAERAAAGGVGWKGEPLSAGGRFLEVRRAIVPDGGVVISLADVTERHRVDAVMRDLAQSVPAGGEVFFETLAQALARAVSADAVWVGESLEEGRMRLLGKVVDGEVGAGDIVTLEGTPCGQVIGRSLAAFPKGVRGLFPRDSRLAALGAESYCGAPLFDSGGRPLGVVAVLARRPMESPELVENLSRLFAARAAAELERLRTINALRESEARYRQLVDLAPYGIAIWDGEAIRFANTAAAAILGGGGDGEVDEATPRADGRAAALEGARLAPFFQDGGALEAQLATGIGKQGARIECGVVRPSGEWRFVELGAYPAAYRGGDAVLLVLNDITERRRAEAELQRSQKMEAVGRMAGGIAHEFNNMLTAIGGFARLAERNPADPDRVLTCVREIAKASDRAAALTGQLLDFSRRRVTEELEVVDLVAMVRDLRVFLKPLISAGIELDLDIRCDAIHAVANPVTLNQALLNLAINARDAMPEGGTLTITLDRMTPDDAMLARYDRMGPGSHAVIRITDSGGGIPDEVRDRIWEPFFTTKDLGKGTGLGLWMVYGTVEQAGGVITMDTEMGIGTVFAIHLPEHDAPEPGADDADLHMLEEGEAAYILLVDDEESVRAFMRLALEEAGCVVTEAEDGLDGLTKYDEAGGLFDAVVTDVSMPRMGGAEMAEALLERNPELRILFLTGYASRDKAAGLQAHPGWRLLMKPIDPDRLVDSVRSLIRDS